MTYELIIEIALKSFVTSGLALLLLALLKDRSAGERSWIAHIGLVATLAIPLGTFFVPRWHVESSAAAVPSTLAGTASAEMGGPVASIAPVSAPVEPPMPIDLESIAFWFYALVAAGLLLVTLLAVVRLFALRRGAAVLVEPKWLSALAHAQRRMGFKHGTALLVSDALASPVSWGVLRPIILLNEEAVTSEAEAEAIIAHELAHVAHLDWAKLLVARAATALFWFNPLVWLLARQCHQLREEAADDAVLLSEVPSTEYAALLIGAARHDSKGALLAANGVAPGRGSLKRRVTRVLDAKLQRGPARTSWGLACTFAGLAVAAPLSALTAVTPPESFAGTSISYPARPAQLALVAGAAAASAREAIASAASIGVTSTPAAVVSPVPEPVRTARVEARAAPENIGAVVEGAVTAALAEVKQELGPQILAQARTRADERKGWADKSPGDAQLFRPTAEQLISLQVHRISADYVRALAEAGYPNLSYKELMSAGIHGVTPDYVRSVKRAGYDGLSMEQLTSMRIHRIDASFINGLAEAGQANLSYKDLINAAVHRVTPEFIRGMTAAGYPGLSMKQLTAMRIHRVSPDFVREMRSLGVEKPSAGQLIEMRLHGMGGAEQSRDRKITFTETVPHPKPVSNKLPFPAPRPYSALGN